VTAAAAGVDCDVAIVGAGMVGATLACCLAEGGLRVALVEAAPPPEDWPADSVDARVSALTAASRQIFRRIGAWRAMVDLGVSPFDRMQVWDAGGAGSIRFDCAEIGEPPAPQDAEDVVALSAVAFDALAAYDRRCFPAPRPRFLKGWIAQPNALALGLRRGGTLAGYGVVRRCREGCKIGPLFADDRAAAEALYLRLAGFAAGGALFLDAPENNPEAMALVQAHRMTEVFGCARMYLGPTPAVAQDRVFGVTTFELG